MSMPSSGTVVGLLYPGFGAEDDFPALERRLGGVVRLPLVHTSVDEDAHRVDALLDLGSAERLAEGAKALAASCPDGSPDSVMWACTSGSFVFGWDGARRQVEDVAGILGVPASSTSIAFAEAAGAMGLRKVSVSASYPEDVASRFADFLRHAGVEVVALRSGGIVTAAEVGTLPKERVLEMVRTASGDGTDAVLVPDTAMHSLAWVDELEVAAGRPVLTANQVTVWEGLRIAGGPTRLDGLGSLFRL